MDAILRSYDGGPFAVVLIQWWARCVGSAQLCWRLFVDGSVGQGKASHADVLMLRCCRVPQLMSFVVRANTLAVHVSLHGFG